MQVDGGAGTDVRDLAMVGGLGWFGGMGNFEIETCGILATVHVDAADNHSVTVLQPAIGVREAVPT